MTGKGWAPFILLVWDIGVQDNIPLPIHAPGPGLVAFDDAVDQRLFKF